MKRTLLTKDLIKTCEFLMEVKVSAIYTFHVPYFPDDQSRYFHSLAGDAPYTLE